MVKIINTHLLGLSGYYYDFPFLDETCDIAVDDNYVRPLYKQMINIKHPTMAFIGIPFRSFIFPLFEIQVCSSCENIMFKKLNSFMIINSCK